MHRKSDALDKFIELNVESENQLGKHIKAFQIDQDEKYISSLIESFLKEYVECTWNSTPKWSSGKKKSSIDGHGEIYDEFLITSCILWRWSLVHTKE